jgi:protease I
MARILIPIPLTDFDPTETGVPWKILRNAGHDCVFASPDGRPGQADPRMLSGAGLGPLATVLRAQAVAREAYAAMAASAEFRRPVAWADATAEEFDALLLPGGHAKGMRPYLESTRLQAVTQHFFAARKPVAAICHGTLLAARSRGADGKSVLYGRKTTGLPRRMELTAWALTCLWLGDYYRTYPTPLEDEVKGVLRTPDDFDAGPTSLRRDTSEDPQIGFTVRDGSYLSARWPGDAHRFGLELAELLAG